MRYALLLNGEWYSTHDTWQEAQAQQERILDCVGDEDFRRYYGDFPSIEIKALKD